MDLQSELAIFQLLEDDFRAVALAETTRKVQKDGILTAAVHSVIESPSDDDISLSWTTADAQIAHDQAFAELLQSQEASLAVSRQYAQRLAAAEQKIRIDSEFARKLQDRDYNADGCDVDR